MLNGIRLINFGNHRDTEVFFGPMTALVGQNGSGKTTVMRALKEIDKAVEGTDKEINPAFVRLGSRDAALTTSWPTTENEVLLDIGLHMDGGTKWTRRRRLGLQDVEPWLPEPLSTKQEAFPRRSSRHIEFFDEDYELPPPGEIQSWHSSISWSCRYFKTSARLLQGPSYAESSTPRLADDGSQLAWTLAYLMTAEPDRFAKITEALREVVPIVRRVRARPVQIARLEKKSVVINKQERTFDETQSVMGQELIFDMGSGDGLPASAVSEGTLVTLAILTLVYGGDDADMIMLDDVELGLHPKAQKDLMRQLRRLQETHPKLQMLVSTHSPYVVDEMKPEEVWLLTTDPAGCAISAPLSEHPDAKRAMEVLTTGEFWSAEGEQWVAQEHSVKERRRTQKAR